MLMRPHIFRFSLALVLLLASACKTPHFVEKTEKLSGADQLLAQNAAITQPYQFSFRGKEFVGFPNVYSPRIFPGAQKQSDLPIEKGARASSKWARARALSLCSLR